MKNARILVVLFFPVVIVLANTTVVVGHVAVLQGQPLPQRQHPNYKNVQNQTIVIRF